MQKSYSVNEHKKILEGYIEQIEKCLSTSANTYEDKNIAADALDNMYKNAEYKDAFVGFIVDRLVKYYHRTEEYKQNYEREKQKNSKSQGMTR